MAITQCAQHNVEREAVNVGKSLASLGKLIGLLNLFLEMIGGPEIPDLSELAGRPLDETIEPLDAMVASLQDGYAFMASGRRPARAGRLHRPPQAARWPRTNWPGRAPVAAPSR